MDKIKSVMIGHAIGDALGVPVEFRSRDYLTKNPVTKMLGFGTYDVPAGTWSDDTSMALCALDSLSNGSLNYDDIMKNFVEWYYHNKFTATGIMFDVGNTCAEAIMKYFDTQQNPTKCGRTDELSNGNGSLMRIHPFVLYAYYNQLNDEDEFVNLIANASSLTHAHLCSVDGCIIYAYILMELLNAPSKQSIYDGMQKAKQKVHYLNTHYNRLLNNDIKTYGESSISSSGYVVDTLEAAVWCLLTTENYHNCVLKAVNLGSDTDTVAAIAGGLAGALYGVDSMPQDWLNELKNKDYIEDMCAAAYKNWRQNGIQNI